jgi:hypothetical protein
MRIASSRYGLTLVVASLLASSPVEAKSRRSTPSKVNPAPVSVEEPALTSSPSPARLEPIASATVKPEASVSASSKTAGPALFERIGVTVEYFGEGSRMEGEQWINNFRADESFAYGAGSAASTLYLLSRFGAFRLGPGIRFLGNYGSNDFQFGYLTQLHAQGELSLRAFEQVDAVFGALAGFTVLFPGEDFSEEIRRLQAQNADVWSVPRLGWVAGLNVGARRRIAGNLYGRIHFDGQLGHQWLFATDQIVDGLRFRKYWGTDIRRLGAALGIEVTF